MSLCFFVQWKDQECVWQLQKQTPQGTSTPPTSRWDNWTTICSSFIKGLFCSFHELNIGWWFDVAGVFPQGHHQSKEFIVSQTPLSSTVADFWRMILEHNTHFVVRLQDTHCQVQHTHTHPQVFCIATMTMFKHTLKNMFSCFCQSVEGQSCVFWPSKDQPMNFEGFTVSYVGEEHLCLSNDERLLVQDFTVQCPQVTYTHTQEYTVFFIYIKISTITVFPFCFSLPLSRTIMCWKCVSTALPAGRTLTVPSETVLIWSTRWKSTADIQTHLQSYMIREYNTDTLAHWFLIYWFLCKDKSTCVRVCVV